jgi:hypothetical protein
MKTSIQLQLIGSLALGLTSLVSAEGISGPDSYGSVGYVSMAEVVAKADQGPQTYGYETLSATFRTLMEYQEITAQFKEQQLAKLRAEPIPKNQKADNLLHGYGTVGYTGLTRYLAEVSEYYMDDITFGYESTGYDAEQF